LIDFVSVPMYVLSYCAAGNVINGNKALYSPRHAHVVLIKTSEEETNKQTLFLEWIHRKSSDRRS